MDRAHPIDFFTPKNIEQHLRAHRTGTDCVDPNTVSSVFDRSSFRQSKDSVLAGHIVASTWCGQDPADRRSIDDRSPAALRQHLFHLVLNQEKQRLYVHSENTVEVLLRLIDE